MVLPQGRRLRVGPLLSSDARRRLRWMDYYLAHERNIAQTCRHFDISRPTFYRWWHRYNPRNLQTLEDDRRTRRPQRVRHPETPLALQARVRALRETYPRWGERKLAALLRAEGWTISHATIGRVLGRLRRTGQLDEPAVVRTALHKKRRRAQLARRYARRRPDGHVVCHPGDLIQLDTTPITLYPGCQRVHVTARDVVSRKDVLAAYGAATSRAAERFLRDELPRMGFPIRAIQIDGGSEFKARFERACEALGITLFVLPPRSPQLNGHVERAHRTHQEEFYDLVEVPEDLGLHNALLREHEAVYNGLRPHQALGYLTPNEFLARCQADHR
ncbi:MAG TPA: helix-turn-helix domain-containing protein [bacterium]|nr:helix-turn-helix domain-containing protein [bacterium]